MINWLFQHLRPILQQAIRRPIAVFSVSLLVALAGFVLATNLRIDNDLSKLIPQIYPSVQALNTLRNQVGAEHELAVAIHSPSFEANKQFAKDLIDPALNLWGDDYDTPYFFRAEFKKEINFLQQNALYLATDDELNLLEKFLTTKITEAKQEANPFFVDLEEDDSVDTDSLGEELDEKYKALVGSEYNLSADSTILVVKFFPSGAQTDLQFIKDTYADLNQLIDQLVPSSYHPQMEVVAAGRLIRTLIEIETITDDVIDSFGAGVLLLMSIVVLYFSYKGYRRNGSEQLLFHNISKQLIQIPAYLLLIGLPLAFSLCWTFGITYIIHGTLNIMTSTLGLLLFGMGIDFGIHFFARYAEQREKGETVDEAIITTFMTTGQAIFTVGLTTSAGFFILLIADFKGFSEFGMIAGIGLQFAIIAYLFFLPALLVLLEQSPILNLQKKSPKSSLADHQNPYTKSNSWKNIAIGIIGISIVVTAITLIKLPNLSFEYDFGKLEPKYERYRELNQKVWNVYSDRETRNAAYIIVDNASHAPKVAEILRERAAKDTITPTIREVEIFQDRFPATTLEIQHKLNRLKNIRALLSDPFIKENDSKVIQRLRSAASTKTAIPLKKIPDFLKAPFTSKNGDIGNLVIIYPSVGLSDGRNSMNFTDDVGKVTLDNNKTYYAGSTSIVASDMLRLMIAEAPTMLILTILFIIIFKLLILHKVKWMIFALLPLIASFIWLFGLMDLLGWRLNLYNLVVLPTILGIGDDSGIHIVHRYLEEGKKSIKTVLKSTGEHVLVSGFTTMLGFSGLLFSIHPGMRSIGEVAILGIGLSLITALVTLPALLILSTKLSSKDFTKDTIRG
ncbi:efflux RND transporter permease subunit [Fodinibius saliphilus]|uniref:efflux RND transporter permease subunit n=1 Tax=Fodinibius saliphilus TaxID=1920650 RepID=UPI001108A482|nr:MMPL family transporter [Fodinibius saliphilus]